MSYFRTVINPFLGRNSILQVTRRYFLSNAFECKEVWDSRLNHPLFKRVNIESMYYELDQQFNRTRALAPVDVDVFVNKQNDDSFLTEVEELVYRFRDTRLAHKTLPSTHHAFVKLFLQYKKDDLVRILHDRLNYGIFPDNYLLCYLIDKYLKAEDFRNAAKVASLPMFQEDYSHKLSNYLSLYAIHRYLNTDIPWEDVEEKPVVDEEEEDEVKVRVSYLRNPYFDDHFDLTDGQHICGKSLVMISSTLEDVTLSNSYKVMGLALYNKWEKLEIELNRLIELQKNTKEPILYKDALDFSSKIINEKLKDDVLLDKIQKLVSQIKEQSCHKDNLLNVVENLIKETVKTQEAEEISTQEKLYKEWETLRENELKSHLAEIQRQNRLREVERKKLELLEKEQLMFFFENEDEIDRVCEKKAEQLRKRERFKTAEQEETEYIPPEVQKRVTE